MRIKHMANRQVRFCSDSDTTGIAGPSAKDKSKENRAPTCDIASRPVDSRPFRHPHLLLLNHYLYFID